MPAWRVEWGHAARASLGNLSLADATTVATAVYDYVAAKLGDAGALAGNPRRLWLNAAGCVIRLNLNPDEGIVFVAYVFRTEG